MPRYVIHRQFDPCSDEELQDVVVRSKQLIRDRFPEITWEHSHVCTGEDGSVTSYCVYEAPDIDLLHEHAGALGMHGIAGIFEIVGDIDPADIRA